MQDCRLLWCHTRNVKQIKYTTIVCIWGELSVQIPNVVMVALGHPYPHCLYLSVSGLFCQVTVLRTCYVELFVDIQLLRCHSSMRHLTRPSTDAVRILDVNAKMCGNSRVPSSFRCNIYPQVRAAVLAIAKLYLSNVVQPFSSMFVYISFNCKI